MNRQLDSDRLVESWLAEGPSRLPDRVMDNIVTHIEQNPQRRSFWLPRRQQMNRMTLAVGGVAAAILLVVVGAVAFAGLGANRSGVGTQPTLVPTQEPTASPAIEPTVLPFSGPIAAGRYYVRSGGHRFSFVVPDGWQAHDGFAVSPEASLEDASQYGSLAVWGPISNVYVDGCHWSGNAMNPRVGASVQDFATAIAAQDGWTTSQATDFTLSGYEGVRLQLTIPDGIDFADCDSGEFRTWNDRWYREPGQVDDVRVLDLDGTRRLFLTTHYPETSAETLTELDRVVATLEIEAVTD